MRSAPRGPTGDRHGRAGSCEPTSHAAHTAASLLSPGRGRPRAPPTAPQSVSSCTRPVPSRASRSQAGPSQQPALTILLVAQTQVIRKPKGPPGGSCLPFFRSSGPGDPAFQSFATRPLPPQSWGLCLRGSPPPGRGGGCAQAGLPGRWLHLPASPVHRLCAA